VSPNVSALVLAAGASRRMGSDNKLLCRIDGQTLIAKAVRAAVDSNCTRVIVVTGRDAERIEAQLGGMRVDLVRNPDYRQGMSGSLRRGLEAVTDDSDAVLVLLADMPGIGAEHIDRLISAFDSQAPCIVAPARSGRRGHPVLWPRRFFAAMKALQGDVGARELLARHASEVRPVEFDTDAIFEDVDTPEQLASMQRRRRQADA
jgi:molybdenum cofactor cytidylyltransferase